MNGALAYENIFDVGWDLLVKSIADQPARLLYGRLAMFGYLPPPSSSRGVANKLPAHVVADVNEVQRFADRQPDPEYQRVSGVALLLVGDFEQAIRRLERAVSRGPESAATRSDLAVAYLSRGTAKTQERDFRRALSQADRAIRLDPSLKAPYFNRALALEQLHSDLEAKKAWEEVVRREAGSPWALEAEAHLNIERSR